MDVPYINIAKVMTWFKRTQSSLLWFVNRAIKVAIIMCIYSIISFYYVKYAEIGLAAAQEKYTNVRQEVINYFNLVEKPERAAPALAAVEYDSPEIPAENKDLKSVVERYSEKYKLNPVVAWVMIERESKGKTDRIRFEENWKKQYSKKWPKQNGMTEIEYDMLFSSIGLMQVGYGLHRERCGLTSVSDLFSPEKNIDCGLSFIADCLDKNKNLKTRGARLRECFKEYNGDGPVAEKYAVELMGRLADFMVGGPDEIIQSYNMTPFIYPIENNG